MRFLEKRIPPPIVAILFGLGVWGISTFHAVEEVGESLRIGAALIFIATGLCLDIAGIIYFKRTDTTVNPLKPELTSSLVQSGIYRYSRNPMYLGLVCFLLAWTVYLSSPFSVIAVIGFIVYLNYFQIAPEERALLALFGDDYKEYQSRVRRWL